MCACAVQLITRRVRRCVWSCIYILNWIRDWDPDIILHTLHCLQCVSFKGSKNNDGNDKGTLLCIPVHTLHWCQHIAGCGQYYTSGSLEQQWQPEWMPIYTEERQETRQLHAASYGTRSHPNLLWNSNPRILTRMLEKSILHEWQSIRSVLLWWFHGVYRLAQWEALHSVVTSTLHTARCVVESLETRGYTVDHTLACRSRNLNYWRKLLLCMMSREASTMYKKLLPKSARFDCPLNACEFNHCTQLKWWEYILMPHSSKQTEYCNSIKIQQPSIAITQLAYILIVVRTVIELTTMQSSSQH